MFKVLLFNFQKIHQKAHAVDGVPGVPGDAQEHSVQEESGKKQKRVKQAASVCDPKPESHL